MQEICKSKIVLKMFLTFLVLFYFFVEKINFRVEIIDDNKYILWYNILVFTYNYDYYLSFY